MSRNLSRKTGVNQYNLPKLEQWSFLVSLKAYQKTLTNDEQRICKFARNFGKETKRQLEGILVSIEALKVFKKVAKSKIVHKWFPNQLKTTVISTTL